MSKPIDTDAESEIEDAFDAMSEGIAIYDAEHRLVRCNKRFQEFYAYTDEEIKPGTHFDELIQYDLKKGIVIAETNSGHVADRISQRENNHGSLDLELADGRWLQIRDRKTSTGGTVTVQTDITELKLTQKSAQETEAILADALEHMSEGFAIYDEKDRLVYFNRKFKEFYNYPEDDSEIIGKSFLELGYKDMNANVIEFGDDPDEFIARRKIQRRSLAGAFDLKLTSGRWLQIRDRMTSTGRTVSIQADITDRKNLERKLTAAKREADAEVVRQGNLVAEQEQQMHAIVEVQTEMIARLDTNLKVTYANKAYKEAFLDDPDNDEVLGQYIVDVLVDEDAKKNLIEELSKLTPENPMAYFEHLEKVANGNLQFQSWTNHALFDEHGNLTGYQSAGRDITSARIAEHALASNARERNAIISASIDAIVTFDENGEIREFNPAAVETFGYKRNEVIGKRIGFLIVPGEHHDPQKTILKNYLTDQFGPNFFAKRLETTFKRKDGSTFPAEATFTAANRDVAAFSVFNHEDELSTESSQRFLVAYVRDLTETKKLEKKMIKQREAIVQNEKMGALGSLLANVAHELNNPLAVVVGQADLLAEIAKDEKLQKRADRIKGAANRCASIVRTFLAAVRQKQPEREAFDPLAPVSETMQLLEYAFNTNNIQLNIFAEENLPPVYGDKTQIGQVLTNLLVNTQQALMAVSGERIANISIDLSDKGKCVSYIVNDNGPGIPEDQYSKIFDPFYTTKAEGVGTGIGLSIVNNIVKAHNGSISVDKAPELGGAQFEIKLPIANLEQNRLSRQSGLNNAGKKVNPLKILVLDDEEDVAEIASDQLTIAGYECDIATDGNTAISMIGKTNYDAVISDLRMPKMDGPAFYEAVCKKHPDMKLKFGFFTGDSLGLNARTFLSKPEILSIDKPFTGKDLMELIRKISERENLN